MVTKCLGKHTSVLFCESKYWFHFFTKLWRQRNRSLCQKTVMLLFAYEFLSSVWTNRCLWRKKCQFCFNKIICSSTKMCPKSPKDWLIKTWTAKAASKIWTLKSSYFFTPPIFNKALHNNSVSKQANDFTCTCTYKLCVGLWVGTLQT